MIINFTLIKDKVGVGVSGVVLNQKGQILLVQRNDSKAWSLPGGIVENGESPDQAVVREVKEETGLDVDIVRLTGIYIRHLWKKNILFVYRCQMKNGILIKSDETDDFKWINLKQLVALGVDKKIVVRIIDCVKFDKNVVVKIQNNATLRQIFIWKWQELKRFFYRD